MTQVVAQIPLSTQVAEGRSDQVTKELVQNWYLEPNPQGSKTPYSLHPTPGLTLLATVGDGPIRGMGQFKEVLYVVSGQELYHVDKNYNTTLLGTIPGTGRVSFASNRTQTFIACGPGQASFSVEGTNTPQPTPILSLASATYQDGYAIAIRAGSEQFYISAIDDVTSWAALDFSSADTFGDQLVGCISDHRDLWLVGKQSTEVWNNTGNALFPFQRAGNAVMERGGRAGATLAKYANQVFWLGDDLKVYSAPGYQPQVISTPQIELEISKQTDVSTASAFTYAQTGHSFYVLMFSSKTLVFDIATGLWHVRKSDGIDRWRPGSHAAIWDKQVVGDFENGKIYELDLEVYTDNGETIQRRLILPPLHNNGYSAVMDEFFLDMEMGQGLATGQGSDPLVSLEWSDDGQHTWDGFFTRSFGKIGEYNVQPRWHNLGAFKHRQMRATVTDPVKAIVHGAFTRVEGLISP